MTIVMKEYTPSADEQKANLLFRHTYLIEGPCPEYTQMTEDERIAYLKQGRPHIEFIRAMPLDELWKYTEKISGQKIKTVSRFNDIYGLSGKTREQFEQDTRDALKSLEDALK